MKNLDARIAMSAQGTRVRAHSGRDPTVGKSREGAPADAFEIIFRRMKSQASLADQGVRDSTSQRNPGPGQGVSPSPPRTKSAQLMRIQDRVRAGQTAVTRESGPPPRAEVFGTNMDVGTARAVLQRETVDASSVTLRPNSSTVAMAVPLAEEAVLGSVVAEAEQLIPKSVAGLPAEQFIPESVTGFAVEQLIPKSVTGLAAEQLIPKSVTGLAAEQLIPKSVTGLAAEQFIPESVAVLTLDTRGNGVVAPGDKAEFVMPSVDGMLPGAEAITFVGEPQQGVMRAGDVIAYYPQEAVGEFPAGEAPAGFVLDIPVHASDALLAGDGSIRGQPQEIMGSAAGLLTEPSNGTALSQLAPVQPVVNVAGVVREQLIDQIVRGVRVAQHNESTEVIVQLKPDFLGRLSIRVLADNHAMRVEIRTGSEAVRQVMQDNLADLQQRLSEKGFAFDQFNVLADTGSNPQREPEWNFGAPSIARSDAALKTLEEAPTEQAPLAAKGVIDYFA